MGLRKRLTSYNYITFGCLTILRMWISRVTLSTSDWSLILSFSSILIATFSPVIKWVPKRTLPKVPWPRERPMKKTTVRKGPPSYEKISFLLTHDIMPNGPVGVRISILRSGLSSLGRWEVTAPIFSRSGGSWTSISRSWRRWTTVVIIIRLALWTISWRIILVCWGTIIAPVSILLVLVSHLLIEPNAIKL